MTTKIVQVPGYAGNTAGDCCMLNIADKHAVFIDLGSRNMINNAKIKENLPSNKDKTGDFVVILTHLHDDHINKKNYDTIFEYAEGFNASNNRFLYMPPIAIYPTEEGQKVYTEIWNEIAEAFKKKKFKIMSIEKDIECIKTYPDTDITNQLTIISSKGGGAYKEENSRSLGVLLTLKSYGKFLQFLSLGDMEPTYAEENVKAALTKSGKPNLGLVKLSHHASEGNLFNGDNSVSGLIGCNTYIMASGFTKGAKDGSAGWKEWSSKDEPDSGNTLFFLIDEETYTRVDTDIGTGIVNNIVNKTGREAKVLFNPFIAEYDPSENSFECTWDDKSSLTLKKIKRSNPVPTAQVEKEVRKIVEDAEKKGIRKSERLAADAVTKRQKT